MTRAIFSATLAMLAACASTGQPAGANTPFPWTDPTSAITSEAVTSFDLGADLTPLSVLDLARPGDLAHAPDFGNTTPAGEVGCRGYALCYTNCGQTSTDQQSYNQCAQQCDAKASPAAVQLLDDVDFCGLDACASAGRCANRNDQSANCLNCAFDAVSVEYGSPCSGDPICNTPACTTKINQCNANLP